MKCISRKTITNERNYIKNQFESERRNCMENEHNNSVPLWHKYMLSIEEASEYFRIGTARLREFIKEHQTDNFVFWNGTRPLIKRCLFERYIDNASTI